MTTAVFIAAHQDDELLTFGSGIVQHVEAGQRVVVVLATDGGAAHVPHVDKYLMDTRGWPSSNEEVTVHRDFEFGWTVTNLGAEYDIPSVRGADGALGDVGAHRVLDYVRRTYGADARIKTHSPFDSHPDHAALGRALQDAYDSDTSMDVRFYIAPHKVAQARARGEILPPLSPARRTHPSNAWAAYELWAPTKAYNRYWATPSGAVKSLIDAHKRDPLTYSHKPL